MSKRIIVISGNGSGAGKTTFAKKVGDQVFSIAGALRGELSKTIPRIDWYRKDQIYKDTTIVWELPGKPTVRKALTDYGQQACLDDPQYWVKRLLDHLKGVERIADCTNTIAIDDVRKMCELDAFKNAYPDKIIHVHIVGKGAKEEPMFDNDLLGAVADYWVEW